jgi:hypothetical protein
MKWCRDLATQQQPVWHKEGDLGQVAVLARRNPARVVYSPILRSERCPLQIPLLLTITRIVLRHSAKLLVGNRRGRGPACDVQGQRTISTTTNPWSFDRLRLDASVTTSVRTVSADRSIGGDPNSGIRGTQGSFTPPAMGTESGAEASLFRHAPVSSFIRSHQCLANRSFVEIASAWGRSQVCMARAASAGLIRTAP